MEMWLPEEMDALIAELRAARVVVALAESLGQPLSINPDTYVAEMRAALDAYHESVK